MTSTSVLAIRDKEENQKFYEIFGDEVTKTSQAKDTLFCTIKGVDCSFFTYPYKLIREPVIDMGITLTSLEDLAAMKLVAVSRRPAKRDYINIYYLLDKFSLGQMLDFAQEKFPNFNFYYTLKALTYFEDIKDDEKRKIEMTDKTYTWGEAKNKITQEVKNYQLGMIKN